MTSLTRKTDNCDELDTIEHISVESSEFQEVLELRCEAYGRDEAGKQEDIDHYSLHFIYKQGTVVSGALRVTCRQNGPLESEEVYPDWLLEEYGNSLCASSRMCVRRNATGTNIPTKLTRFAWQTVLPLGVRLDVSKARLSAIPYYMRKLNYYYVLGSQFEFHRWRTRCALIAYPAHTGRGDAISDLFQGISHECDVTKRRYWHRFTDSLKAFKSERAQSY
jgi:hypothetical protein